MFLLFCSSLILPQAAWLTYAWQYHKARLYFKRLTQPGACTEFSTPMWAGAKTPGVPSTMSEFSKSIYDRDRSFKGLRIKQLTGTHLTVANLLGEVQDYLPGFLIG